MMDFSYASQRTQHAFLPRGPNSKGEGWLFYFFACKCHSNSFSNTVFPSPTNVSP